MTNRLQVTGYRLQIIYQVPFISFCIKNWQLIIDNSLKIENCKLIIASKGGARG